MAPYALGAWLGDGTADQSKVTGGEKKAEVVAGIVACGYAVSAVSVHKTTGVPSTRFGSGVPNVKSLFRRHLEAAGVWGNKHIPEAYRRSSIKQRLELLAGLIDTDGHVEASTGRVRIGLVWKSCLGRSVSPARSEPRSGRRPSLGKTPWGPHWDSAAFFARPPLSQCL